jgi:hypothetical protein
MRSRHSSRGVGALLALLLFVPVLLNTRTVCGQVIGGFGAGAGPPRRATGLLGANLDVDWGATLVPRNGQLVLEALDNPDVVAAAVTVFDFHPPRTRPNFLTKNFNTGQVPHQVQLDHDYAATDELHRTSGNARHYLEINYRSLPNPKPNLPPVEVPFLRDSVTARLQPGFAEDRSSVSIKAALRDPIAFSDTSPDAAFAFSDEGLNIPFSLGSVTAFPDVFAASPGDEGAIAEDTSFTMRVRVAPGVYSDPDAFWADGLAGAIDLFSVTLQSDALFNVDATLVVGTSTADFLIDSGGIATAEATLENAFAGNQGRLLADLMDVFWVGFQPQAGVSEYTVGYARDADVAGWEPVPEPSGLLLLAVGALTAAAWRCVRHTSRAGTRTAHA